MIPLPPANTRIFIRPGATNMRKAIKGLANITIKVVEEIAPLQLLLLDEIKKSFLPGFDETRFQVLIEPGRRAYQLSFLWHIRAIIRDGPVPIFLYRPERSAKFVEANKAVKNNSDTIAVSNLYGKIYKVESDWRKGNGKKSELLDLRQKQSRPLMDELKKLLDQLPLSVNPSGKPGQAFLKHLLNRHA